MFYYLIQWTEKVPLFGVIVAKNEKEAVKKWSQKTKQQHYDCIEKCDTVPPFSYFIMSSVYIK